MEHEVKDRNMSMFFFFSMGYLVPVANIISCGARDSVLLELDQEPALFA